MATCTARADITTSHALRATSHALRATFNGVAATPNVKGRGRRDPVDSARSAWKCYRNLNSVNPCVRVNACMEALSVVFCKVRVVIAEA